MVSFTKKGKMLDAVEAFGERFPNDAKYLKELVNAKDYTGFQEALTGVLDGDIKNKDHYQKCLNLLEYGTALGLVSVDKPKVELYMNRAVDAKHNPVNKGAITAPAHPETKPKYEAAKPAETIKPAEAAKSDVKDIFYRENPSVKSSPAEPKVGSKKIEVGFIREQEIPVDRFVHYCAKYLRTKTPEEAKDITRRIWTAGILLSDVREFLDKAETHGQCVDYGEYEYQDHLFYPYIDVNNKDSIALLAKFEDPESPGNPANQANWEDEKFYLGIEGGDKRYAEKVKPVSA